MFLSLIGIVYSGFSIYKVINQYQVSADNYQEIEKIFHEKAEAKSGFQTLLEMNSDFVGWLDIENTRVSYPVVHGEDNDFYLTHNFDRVEDKVGAIFMDYRNEINSFAKNLIIYGHNMKDGSMFGTLKEYLDPTYFKEQNMITFEISDRTYIWEVFSVYESSDLDWMVTSFGIEDDYQHFLDEIVDRSVINSEMMVSQEDHILTLATCTSSDEKRFVLHAKLIN